MGVRGKPSRPRSSPGKRLVWETEMNDEPRTMVVYYDTAADAAHIALRGGIGPGETVRTVQACDDKVNLDFNAAGQLIGIELLDLDMLHPDLAKHAIQMRPIRDGDLS